MFFYIKKTSLCHQVSGTKKDCGTTQIDVRENFPQYIPLRQYDSQTKMIGRYASTKTLTKAENGCIEVTSFSPQVFYNVEKQTAIDNGTIHITVGCTATHAKPGVGFKACIVTTQYFLSKR